MKLKDYISGKREGKDANRLEQDALNNPFLHEAIDGYDAFDGDHLPALESLEKELDKRINKKRGNRFLRRKMIWIAASIALLIGIGSFFMIRDSGTDKKIVASNEPLVKKDSSIVNEEGHLPVGDGEDSLQTVIPDEVVSTPLIADYSPVPSNKQSEKKKTSSNSYFDREKAEVIDEESVTVSDIKVDSLIIDSSFDGFMADTYEPEEIFLSVTKRTGQIPDKSGKSIAGVFVEGTALDGSGEPSIGVNVYIEGTTIGTITDLDGRFKLSVPSDVSDRKLIASYIGYEPQEFTLPAGDDLAYIHLKPSAGTLDEVVVIGYGTQKKKDITGSISRVKAKEEFARQAVTKKTGQILDEFGDPMVGVNVFVEGTAVGTITDIDGRFALDIPADIHDKKLITSYIGYEPQEFMLPAGDDLAYVHLEPSTSALEEVVVVGYGVQRKSSMTGSVSRIKDKKDKFAKRQFKVYLAENLDTNLCEEKVVKVSVKFYLDNTGTPTSIQVSPVECEALEDELVYLLENGPKWSKRNKYVKLRFKIRFE